MTLEEFTRTIDAPAPPPVSAPLLALWHDARGDWDAAHEVAQDVKDESGAWVHVYLHRKEGDLPNASDWDNRANRPVQSGSLESEWEQIASALLSSRP